MEESLARTGELARRAARHAALAEPSRLAIVDALRLSDRSPSSLARWLGLDSNLLAHHLDVLARAGLIERVVSSGDRRRRYVRLKEDALGTLFSEEPLPVRAVLFVCTHNSARSQLAAALWNRKSAVPGESAGTHPADRVHPLAVTAAAHQGLDLSGAVPHSLSEVTILPDLIVTVCDQANEELNASEAPRIHWSVPDPTGTGRLSVFEATLQTLDRRTDLLSRRVSAN